MSKLKVAILEDSELLLKSLQEDLEETQLVEVQVSATNSRDFLDKMKTAIVDALVLDIDLAGDSVTGLDIATRLQLPVLFVSGKTELFIHGIEDLDMDVSLPVCHISKPITTSKLKKILPKFINEINSIERAKFVTLRLKDSKATKVPVDSIVFIETETGSSGTSNNKKIYFTNRKPETLFNFSLKQMEAHGFDPKVFITIRSSHRVNVNLIKSYNKNHEVEVTAMNAGGKLEQMNLPVSKDYRKKVSRFHP